MQTSSRPRMRIVIGIPTVSRAAILCETLRELTRQSRPADATIICGAVASDVAGAETALPGVRVVLSKPGLPRQRNAIMDAATDSDILLFLDDDFLPQPGYLAELERCMAADPTIALATGAVIADGIGGQGFAPAEGRVLLQRDEAGAPRSAGAVAPVFSGYGCNMAVRMDPMRAHGLRFDERLPLYGWQEDVDLSRRLAAHGSVVRLDGARGVHLGVKSGRASGVRLGYSQVANPIYLVGKRAGYPAPRAIEHILRNMAMNSLRAAWPEAYVDRRGRLRGNWLAVADLLRGRLVPERILEL